MFILHVDLFVKPKMNEVLERIYGSVFGPAISQQPGFSETRLLRPIAAEGNTYRLVIAFVNEKSQKEWVATDLHQEVWPQIEALLDRYSVHPFEAVG
jgi:heme-degrading monooxygenase HmoA